MPERLVFFHLVCIHLATFSLLLVDIKRYAQRDIYIYTRRWESAEFHPLHWSQETPPLNIERQLLFLYLHFFSSNNNIDLFLSLSLSPFHFSLTPFIEKERKFRRRRRRSREKFHLPSGENAAVADDVVVVKTDVRASHLVMLSGQEELIATIP